MKKLSLVVLVGLIVVFASSVFAAGAERLPMPDSLKGKTVSWYIGFTPGGQTDLGARMVAKVITEQTGLNVVIVNVEGGASSVAMTQCLESTPNGTSVFSIGSSAFSLMAQGTLPYTVDDMTWIASMYSNTTGLFVRADSPIKTLADFEKAIKEGKPGDFPVGIGSTMNPAEAIIILLGDIMDAEEIFYPVNYAGDSRAATELLGGSVKFANVLPGGVKSLIDSGEIRMLFSGTYERMPDNPDIPCVTELSFFGENTPYSDYAYMNNYVVGPKGMPEDVAAWMAQAWNDAVNSEEFQAQARAWGVNTEPMLRLDECKKAGQLTIDSYKEYIEKYYK